MAEHLDLVDPLQNDEILEHILKYLSLDDLLSSRQVCRAWRRESAKAMRSCAKVVFDLQENPSDIQQFLELVQSTESIFTQKPFVSNYTIKSTLAIRQNIPAQFWEFCGSSIKTLHLSHLKYSSARDFQVAIFQCCPNLEKLHLEEIEFYGNMVEPTEYEPPIYPQNWNLKSLKINILTFFVVPWMEILSHFPALEDLDIKSLYSRHSSGDKLFRSLALSRMHNDQCWKLKSLAINLDFIEDPLQIVLLLENGNLKLETFEVIGTSSSNHMGILQRIVSVQNGCLKTLSLDIRNDPRTSPVAVLPLLENTVFEKLEKLEISNTSIRSLQFLRSLPNLKKLTFWIITMAFEQDDFDNDNWSLQSCQELELHLNTYYNVEGLPRLSRRVPNVTSLKASGIRNEHFSVICAVWQDLTFLKISKSEVDDTGISGFDKEHVKRMNRKGEAGSWRPITVPRANITCLKDLKSFHWESSNQCRLDYCAAAYGIQLLPNLRHLRMDGYPKVDWNRICNQYPWGN